MGRATLQLLNTAPSILTLVSGRCAVIGAPLSYHHLRAVPGLTQLHTAHYLGGVHTTPITQGEDPWQLKDDTHTTSKRKLGTEPDLLPYLLHIPAHFHPVHILSRCLSTDHSIGL